MTKLRSIAVMAVLGAALFASPASAADGTWNTKYGMIFGVQNIFQNGNASALSGFDGQVGLHYTLGPQSALRLIVSLSRASQATLEGSTTNELTGVTTDTYWHPLDYTSSYGLGLGAVYLMRLSPNAIAPYLGAGGGVGYARTALDITDTINHTAGGTGYDEKLDDSTQDISLDGMGVLGVEWRVHPSIAIFAEYMLDLNLITWSSDKFHETRTSVATGAVTYDMSSEESGKTFLNWNTGIAHQGVLGLVAFF